MVLSSLYEKALEFRGEGVLDAGYSNVVCHWAIKIYSSYFLVSPMFHELNKKRIVGKKKIVPYRARASQILPMLLDDCVEYCIDLGTRDSHLKNEAYLNLLDKCAKSTNNSWVKKISSWLKHPETAKALIADIKEFWIESPTHKLSGGIKKDRLVFFVNDVHVSHIPEVKKFWQDTFIEQTSLTSGYCLVSGVLRKDILLSTIPFKISGIANVQASGAALVSFDKAAYQTHGWNKNENASIGLEPINKVYSFINYLSNTLAFDDAIANKALLNLRRYHVKLTNCSVLIWSNSYYIDPNYWHNLCQDQRGIISWEKIRFFRDNITGELIDSSELDFSEQINLLVLKGNAGRVAIEGIYTASLSSVLASLKQFIQLQCQFIEKYEPSSYWQLSKPSLEGTSSCDVDLYLIKSIVLGQELPTSFLSFLFAQYSNKGDRPMPIKLLQGISLYFGFKSNQHCPSKDNYPVLLGKIAFCFYQFHVALADYPRANLVSINMKNLSLNNPSAWNLVINCFYQVHLRYPAKFCRLSSPLKRYLLILLQKLVELAGMTHIKLTPIMLCNPMLNNTYERFWDSVFIPTFNKMLEASPHFSSEDAAYFYLGFAQAKQEFFSTSRDQSKVLANDF